MNGKSIPRAISGMRDILPEKMFARQYVIDVIQGAFEEFGFEPLQTPAIEREETLSGQYGSEAERLIYSVTYGHGKERLQLRYDLSVPLCRVVAMNPDIPKPFKRYQIAPVWRADRPQKGRSREFFQCDADTVGSSSMLADAETVAVIYTILHRLGFRQFKTHINNRKILNGIGQYAGIPNNLLRGLYQSIDKLQKVGLEGVRQELLAVGLPDPIQQSLLRVARQYLQGDIELEEIGSRLRLEKVPGLSDDGEMRPPMVAFPSNVAAAVEPALLKILSLIAPGSVEPESVQETAGQLVAGATPILRKIYEDTMALIPEHVVDKLLALLKIDGNNESVLHSLCEQLADFPEAIDGINELEEMLHYLEILGVPEQHYAVDVSMARGLEYYTGPIYETNVEEPRVGSITGGGRFDNLIGKFMDHSIPATGTTIGIERIITVMEELHMFPAEVRSTATKIMVTVFDNSLIDESLATARDLRLAGYNVQLYFDPDHLRSQLGYAATKGIPFVVILGPDEVNANLATVRYLPMEEQKTVDRDELVSTISGWIKE